MGRFARSWGLFKTSMGVVRQDKELLWMPVLSFLATLMAVGAIAGVGFWAGILPQITNENGDVSVLGAVLGLSMYLALAFVQVFFHAATVSAANERLGGGDPTVGSALRGAGRHIGRLFLWSILVATVNVILQAVRERSGTLGRIMASIAGTAWNLATYFVVPVLLFEHQGVGASLKRSGSIFKRTWGETVVGEAGIGFVGGIITMVLVFIGVFLTTLLAGLGPYGLVAGITVTVLAVVVATAIFTVAAAVYKTALFRYATQGHGGGPFDDQQLAGAYRAR